MKLHAFFKVFCLSLGLFVTIITLNYEKASKFADAFFSRLGSEVLSKAIETRLSGGSGALSVLDHITFQNVVIPLAEFNAKKAIHIVNGITLSNSYVSQIATKGGFFGFFVILLFFLAALKTILRGQALKNQYERSIYVGNILAIICILIYSNIENLLMAQVSLIMLFQCLDGFKRAQEA